MSYDAPPPPPNPYGQPAYGGGQPQTTSVMSIISLVVGIIGIPLCGCFVFSIAAIVLGFLGRNEIDKSGGAKKGRGLATAGLVIGAVTLVLAILINVLVFTDVIDVDTSYYN